MKKRVFACILALCLCVGLFVGLIAGCSHSENAPDPSKPQIVVTVFPPTATCSSISAANPTNGWPTP